ncbi:DNA helicase-2 / ATP-dependent DNA helicase PcrA [Natronincola peptidivorans]|uniref:DNA helicase-2 / ATP-dependent DNA helicase PcrA n=1 Tax=Natronincola peptidivorans TaxID=426128 RepID=A0A1I0HBW3_9FIRM|nr:RNA polymerase recycling motor HelD [Natronincola peptidivorans]SET80430.1 DNA helicase-2 / ATP-dependent DNA helicase PcrA [Natronincola peptidivorans]
MSVKKHPDYRKEVERLDYTKDYIKKTLDATEEYRSLYKENIKDAMENLDYLDSSQSYISVLINTKFIEIADRNFDNLKRIQDKPYFARIDFKPHEREMADKIYIGKTSLMRSEEEVPLIVDWRSPIANIYYEGRLGETSYVAEGGKQEGELLLKRQFTIEEGELKNIMDIDITTTDTFLQASLEANAEERLKDIASTIQAEQNRVIRADMHLPLIVQGVAGSGKTTIALHRIAYFIYTYEKTFDPENFMIIAPNKLFINYISDVLPELGVEDVKQTTFIDFIEELIGNKYKMADGSDKLMTLIDGKNTSEKDQLEWLKWAAAFKGSMDFKRLLDNYIRDLEKDYLPKDDFTLHGHIIISKEAIHRMLLQEFNYLPLYKRTDELKKTLRNQLKEFKEKLLKETEAAYDDEIENIRCRMEASEERRQKILPLIEERDTKLEAIKKDAKTLVNNYIKRFPKKDLFELYKELMIQEDLIEKYGGISLPSQGVDYLCQQAKVLLENKKIELEDYAPLAYIKHRIFGFKEKLKVNSVVIDEAQDFSLFQFYTLKEILKTNMFTLLGDISQGIHSYRSIQNWEEVRDEVFYERKSNYITLVQSYRTTIEVMNLANAIILKLANPRIVLAKPVIRHGDKPEMREFSEKEVLLEGLQEKLQQIKDNYKSIAIIGKTKKECKEIKKYLDKHKKLHTKILDEKEESYDAGIILVPVHLAKGLEFDAVLITSIEEIYQEEELDIKLLYVAMTRALHELDLFFLKGTMPILNNINEEMYIR